MWLKSLEHALIQGFMLVRRTFGAGNLNGKATHDCAISVGSGKNPASGSFVSKPEITPLQEFCSPRILPVNEVLDISPERPSA